MLYIIKTANDPYAHYLKDDPVRANIPTESRIGFGRLVFALVENDKPQAITCVALSNLVPTVDRDLFINYDNASIAVFYTIWSYEPGSARTLLFDVVTYIKTVYPKVSRFVTLSPKTEMAYRFHIKNGAYVLKENSDTVNYEYGNLVI